jgi:glycosyltransferase involved in cell wall biosynthesis
MRLAIINNTSYGISGGHSQYLLNMIPLLDKKTEIESLLVLSPKIYNYSFCNKLSSKTIFKNFDALRILKGHKCSIELKSILDEYSPDIIFLPNERYIKYNNVPTVVMVRNMEPFIQIRNNPIKEVVVNHIKKYIAKKSCKSANHIIAVSNFVKNSILNNFNINSNKITVNYHGGSVREKTINLIKPKSINTIDLKQFLFTAGSIRPARGLEDLIKALGAITNEYSIIPHLLIAGECSSNMKKYKKSLKKLIRNYNLEEKVVWLGKINKREMGWCYLYSSATVLTSRVESFCMIAQEAMSYGALIISSNNKCLPEILSDSAIYFQPNNKIELASIIVKNVLIKTNTNTSDNQLAISRSKKFSWQYTVNNLVKTLNKVLEQ